MIVKSAAGSTTTDSLMCIFPGVCVETVNAEVQLNLEDFVNILSFSPQEQKALILICNYISEFAVLQPMGNYISSLIKGLSIENWSGTRNFFGCDSNLTFNELSDTFEIDEITTGDLSLFTNRVDKTLGKILSHGSEKKTKSLFELINNCKTSYGKRRLSMWLLNPLKNISIIKSRQSAVSWLLDHSDEAYILKDQWTKELNIIFLRSRGFDTQLAPLRRHTALCSPLGMYRILLFCRSLPPFSALTKQLCQWSVSHNFVLPELIFLIYPFKTIESIGYVADIFFSYLHKDEANGRVSLSNQYLAKETELRRFECQVQSLKQELDLILFSLRKNLESPGLVFKTLKKCTSSNSQTYHDYLIEVDNRDKQMLSRIPTGEVSCCFKNARL